MHGVYSVRSLLNTKSTYLNCKGVSDLKACLDYSFRKFEFSLPIVSNDILLRKIKQPLKKGLGRKTKIQFSLHDDMNNPASKSNSLLLTYVQRGSSIILVFKACMHY